MSWSLSRLKTFETCHAKYDYRYNLKIPDNGGSSAAQRGIDIHAGIEKSIKDRITPVPEEASFVGDTIRSLQYAGVEHRAEFDLKLDKDWKQVITGDYWFHGIIDLYVRTSPTTASFHDWKTGRIYPDHDEQKELYALALFCAYPELEEITSHFDYLDQRKSITRTFHPYMVPAAKERWSRRVGRMQSATEFIPTPGYLCRWCGFSKAKGGPCRF
jgi:hypothetical protein